MKMEQRQRLDRVNKLLVRTRSWVRACYVQQNYIHCTFRWCIQLNQRLTWIKKKLVLECMIQWKLCIELYGVLPFQTRECYDRFAPLPTRLSSLWFLEFKFKISFQVEPKIMGRTNNNLSLDQLIQIDYEALDILTNDIKKNHNVFRFKHTYNISDM